MASDRVRDEAERLVAAAIAAVSLAARGMGAAGRAGSGFATGSPECCVCPVCRLISTMRDPSVDLAERLAGGAGDLATGVTSILRALSRAGHGDGHDEGRGREGDEFWETLRQRAAAQAQSRARPGGYGSSGSGSSGYGPSGHGPSGYGPGGTATDEDGEPVDPDVDPWRAATTAPARPPAPPKPMAKKAVAKKAAPGAVAPATTAEPMAPTPASPSGPAKAGPAKVGPAKVGPVKATPAKVAKKATKAAPAGPMKATKATKAVPPPEEFG